MGEGGSSGRENANLYLRGVAEGRAGEVLDGKELLEVLDDFCEDGLRSYILGHIEGSDDLAEDLEEGVEDESWRKLDPGPLLGPGLRRCQYTDFRELQYFHALG